MSQKVLLFLLMQLSLYSSGAAFFPTFDWISQQNDADEHEKIETKANLPNRQEAEDVNFGHHDDHKGQEVEDIHFGSKDDHKGQEVEEINFGHHDDHKGQEVEDIHFGSKDDHKGQEVEDIHFGHHDDHKGQEVEDIHFGSKDDHKGQEVEEINFGHHDDHKGQEVEEINFGHHDDHKGQEVEDIHFGSKDDHKGQEVEEINFGHHDDHKGQEVEDIHFGSKDDHKGQEVEDIHFGHHDDHKGQEVEDIHFGSKDDHKGQEVEEINFGHHDDHKGQEVEEINFGHHDDHKGQEVEDIHFGSKDDHKGQEVEDIHFGSKDDHKGQEVEEINFGHHDDHKGQEVEEINFGHHDDHKGQEVEDIHFGSKDDHKGQEVEDIHFGSKDDHKGQEVEEINFGHHDDHKGQEVEDIHFGSKDDHKGQEVEDIHFGSKDDHKGQEVEDIHFGSKDDHKGQGVEDIHFGSKDDHKGQEVEDIHFGHHDDHKGQEVEDIHFGSKDDHKGQEVEEINFGHHDDHKGQEVEDIHFGSKDDHKGQEVEDIHFGSKDDHKGQEVEDIHFGSKDDHKGQEVEDIHFGSKDDHKGQEVEEINFGHHDDHKGQEVEDVNSGHYDVHKGQEVEDINFGHHNDHKGNEVDGNWFDIFLPAIDLEGCEGNPTTPPNSHIKCESNRKCELYCREGYRLSTGTEKLLFECDSGKWIPADNITAECNPICEPPCQNDGICIARNQCSCPKNFEGTHCQFTHKPCSDHPPVSQNSYVNCNSSNCVVTCFDNYVFPDGTSTADLECHQGHWTWTRHDWNSLPDCKPTCEPSCINGGSCLDFNKCQCPREYAGPQCQFEIAACDAKKLNFNGFYTCRGENDHVLCTISCPDGQDSDIPIAKEYVCSYSVGKFFPEPVPKCIYGKNTEVIKFHSSSHTIQGGPQGLESSQIPHNSFPSTAKCFSWKKYHYKNFDGQIFSFDGNCSYTLAQDVVGNTFRIISETSKCESNCSRHLKIYYQHNECEVRYEDKTPIFISNGEILQIPNQLGGLLLEKFGDRILISLQTIDVSLNWNEEDHLAIVVNKNMWNKTGGLCGNFNNNPKDDFYTPEGFPAGNLEVFVQSWVHGPYNCESTPDTKNHCMEDNALNYCQKIFSDVHFEKCFNVGNLALYQEACEWDVCKCGRHCACDTISEFVKSCKNYLIDEGVPDSTSNWRQIADCPLNCDVGKVYSVCGPSLQPTCGSFGADNSLKYSECVEGCFCPEGLVLFNDSCIQKEYCPCYWRGKYHNMGEVVMKDCNTCTCQNGEWTCSTLQCSSRCSIIGNSHYFTFDGRRYDFVGQCNYYLLKSDYYSIASENLPCEGDFMNEVYQNYFAKHSTCAKLITIRHKTDEIKLKMKKEIFVNGLEIPSLPVEVDGIIIRKTSHYVIVTLPDGTELWWDENANIYIDMPGNHTKVTGGLCGTFNNNQRDDFKTPEGDIEQTAMSFAEKWKTDETCTEIFDPLLPHPCDDNTTYLEIAENHCQKLKGDTFKDCHPFVDVNPFYKNCLYDVCSCQKEIKFCICPTFADYANECTRQYVELLWRNEVRECGMRCQNGETYRPCGDSCTRSCQDISVMKGQCKKKCMEGCSCPEGLVLNSVGECVLVSECPCIHQNLEYKANQEIIVESENGPQHCICENALWSCKPATKLEIDRDYENSEFKCDERIHEEYTTCKPAEPKTCRNMHEKPKQSSRICFPGCVCKKGYVWDSIGKTCVNASECPCHHGGRSYADGEKIQQDCNSCTCNSGTWSCAERECPSICSAWGDTHFKTFDGKIYDFQGSCEFVLAAGSISDHDGFVINMQIAPCGTTGISCPKSLTLSVDSLGNKKEEVVFKKSKQLSIPVGLERILVREVGVFVFAEVFDLGISVQWDRGTRVYVKADARWKNKVKGLCGSFNDNQMDDFKTPSSGETNEISPVLFADSWRLMSYCPDSKPIIDTCASLPHRKPWAVEKCLVLKSEIFEPCHSEVALEPYLERCVIDTCGCDEGGDCECLCTTIAAYAEECTLRGIPIKWRSQDLCPLQCDGSSNYNPCISKCPPKSCDNQYQHSAMLRTCSEEYCVEGCDKLHCPPGHVLADSSSNNCIPISSCKTVCLTVHNVTYLEGDLMESDDCHSCYCSHHAKVCTGEPCVTGTTPAVPIPTSVCPEGEIWDDCIVKCDHVCNHMAASINSDLQCSSANDCISGCRAIDLICSHGMFLRDRHTCVKKKDCPCISLSNSLVKPGDVVQESECEKCQCVNNEYECVHVCNTPPSVQPTQPSYSYTKKQHPVTPGWDYSQEGNVTLIHYTTVAVVSCASGGYESLVGPLTRFSASSHLDELSSPEFSKMSSNGTWTAAASNADQYLQVDFLSVEPIFAVNVAGVPGNYVTSYYLLHSLNGVKFKDLFDQDGRREVFGGPFDGHHSVKQVLRKPIEARYIRFHPVSWHGQISMKVDVLGCKGLESTTSPPTTPVPSICNKPIGIGQKYFPKLQITVTSSKPNNGPDLLGFDNEKGWQPLTNSKSEWVQLDFGDYANFTGITTKGVSQSNDLSSLLLGDSWVERYRVEYSHDGLSWNPVLDEFGDQMTFMGNTDGETEKKNFFKRPIRAKSLKILPVKWHENIALRLDVMGCFEPSRTEVEGTPPVIVPTTNCSLCPGAVINTEHCTCTEEKWWDGEHCVSRSECPCYNGLMAYPVGSTFTTENCEECVCRLYGLSHCAPKHCHDCPDGLQKVLTPLCGCTCKPCEEKSRLCPTSNICLKESAWCDGIQDCPDDELNCTTPPPKVIPTSTPCLATCPPGYDVVYRNKTAGPSEADDMIQSQRVKSVKSIKTSKSVKTYRKSKKNRKPQRLTECPPYDCVPFKEVPPTACPPPECPIDYSVVYKKHNEELEGACPLYACEPVPDVANCSVLSKNIKTFDEQEYKYEICDHVITTHDSGLWNITALRNCSFSATCATALLINHGNHSLELHPQHRLIEFDSYPYTTEQVELLSSKMADFTLTVLGDSTVFTSDIYGFQVVYDVKGNFNIKVPSHMKGHLAGLCGLYNGHPGDDRTLPDGKLSKTIVEFGDAWRHSGGQECVETVCPIEMQNAALEICLKLKEKPFNLCRVDVNMELCIESACDCLANNETAEDCRCQVLSDFAAKCENSDIFGWRVEHDCPSSCPPNLVHYDCYPYACQPTCGNEECTETATDCYSGCFCPEGLVKSGDKCIRVSECRDCTCTGFGNSTTYVTFDGWLEFNGNCTYVAARESTAGVPSFQVLITKRLRNASDFIACTDKIEVNVPGHSVKVIALPETEEMVKVLVDEHEEDLQEGQKLDRIWAKILLNSEISAVLVELPREHVDVLYFYKTFSFTVSLPSYFYSGKVEGLCGSCSLAGESKEELTDNPEKWQTEKDKSCLIEPPVSCIPTDEHKNACLLMNDTRIFWPCLALVDPTPFIDQCLTLGCVSGHFCGSLEAYGQACRDTGVCVNWRSDELCPLACPPGLQYQACNNGCQKTCDNYDEVTSFCTNTPTEGCFCPNDQVFINGTCKSEKYCELCDEEGHHFEDELWQVDKCTNCTCRNRVVTCEKTECPVIDVTCGHDEILIKEENDFDCCPEHKCVCRHRDECAKIEIPDHLLPGMEAVINETACCPKVELVCRRETCPKTNSCKEHYVQKTYNTSNCCPDYLCEKPDNICIYEFGGSPVEGKRVEREQKVEVVKEVGERWTDGPCRTCVCVEKDGFAETVCSVTECPNLEEHHDYNDYDLDVVYDPEKCCPEVVRKSCKHDGRVYEVGDTWVPDEKNPCETMKCNDWGGNLIAKEIRMEVCNTNCEHGWEYKHSEGACCGVCVQIGCPVEEKIYKPGEVWFSEDECAKSTCKKQNGHYSVTTEMKSCPSVEDCAQEDTYWDDCCLKCKIRSEDKKICEAQPLPPATTVQLFKQRKGRHGLCSNEDPIANLTQCAGNCHSYTVFKPETGSHESVCKCCKPEEYSLLIVPLKCEDGMELTKTITVPSKCACMPCGG